MTKALTAAEQYRKIDRKAEIVDVTVPSGFVFKMEKPSKFGMLFGLGKLPQFAASGAVEKWTEAEIIKGLETGDSDTTELAKAAFLTRDKVVKLSHSPKIVLGDADYENDELSASNGDISDEDLTYLFRWVQAGGDESMMLGTFPRGSQQRPVAQPNRKARRAAAK